MLWNKSFCNQMLQWEIKTITQDNDFRIVDDDVDEEVFNT